MAKKSLARKIMLSIFAGAVLFSNSIVWAEDPTLGATKNDKEYTITLSDGTTTVDVLAIHGSEQITASATGSNSMALGGTASGQLSIAIGRGGTTASNYSAIAVGTGSIATGHSSIVMGYHAKANSTVGDDNSGAIAIGGNAEADAQDAIAFGSRSKVATGAFWSTAIGHNSISNSSNSVAIGPNAKVEENASNSLALGMDAKTSGSSAIAIGDSSNGGASNVIAIGNTSKGSADNAIAIGRESNATGSSSVGIGLFSSASENGAIAIGDYSKGSASSVIAIGSNSTATNTSGIAIGAYSNNLGYRSVALGSKASIAENIDGAVAIGHESAATEDNTVSVGNATTQRRIVNVAVGKNNNDAVNVGQLNAALANVGGLESAVTKVEFNEQSGALTVTTTTDDSEAPNENTINLGTWADSKYATIANVQTVTGLSGWDADAVMAAYAGANDNQGTTYLKDATSLVDADIKLDAAIKDNAEAIKNVYTKTESDGKDLSSASFKDNTITLTKGDNSTITLSDIAKASDLSDLQKSLGATAAATIKDAKYTNDILTLIVGEEDTDGSGNDIKVEGIASQSALSTLSSKVTTLNTNVNKIIGVDDIATENVLSSTYENKIGSSNTNYLAEANTLVAADVALNNAISDINKNIGDLSSLNLGNDIATIISEVYKEAQAHTTVSAGNGITVTGTTSGGSAETTGSNETTSTGTGGTDYKVSANIKGDDTNINVTLEEDNSHKVSLNKEITVESVTSNKVTVNGENGSTVIDGDTVNTTTVNATTANITEKIVVGTEDSQTTIKGDTVTTTNVNTTNVTSSNVTVHNKFEFVDGENVTTTIDKDGMTTNNATVNNTFIVGDTTKNEYTKIEGDTVTITNQDGKTTTIKGDTINSTTINLGNNVTVNNEGMTIEGDTTNVIINKDGITFAGDDNTANGPSINNNGMDMNNTTISNVKDGEVSATSKDAVNGSQLYQEATERMIADQKLNSRLNKVGAGAAALAALHPLDFDPDDKLSFSAGVGNYAGENAAALGMFYRPNEKVMLSMGGTMGNGENMVNMGISFALDKPNNVSNSRVAMAKEIVAMREHIAKQDAQIAQLVMLVNQLTGNVAQQEATPAFSPSGRVRVERLTDGYEEYDRVKIEKGAELDGDNSKTVEAK